MAALLDLHPDSTHPVLSGVAEVHGLLDRMHAGASRALVSRRARRLVAELDRATRRIEALKLKVVPLPIRPASRRTPGSPAPTPGSRRPPPCPAPTQPGRSRWHRAGLRARRHRRGPGRRAGLPRARSSDRPRHRSAARRRERRAAPDGRGVPGGEGGPVQPRPAPPDRPPRDRGRRTRPERRGRPRERAHPHRGASRAGEVLADACTTTATAPPPATSPSPPWPQPCSARSSTR